MTLLHIIKEAMLQNELGGNPKLAYCFSDADGKRTGKSGYSFGLVQFDIENNWDALRCLEQCGFWPKEIKRLFEQNAPIDDLNAKLYTSKAVVDRWDAKHINSSIQWCEKVTKGRYADMEALVHIIDYHNQFYLASDGPMANFIIQSNLPIGPDDILHFKLNNTYWGKYHQNDVHRRYTNIRKIFAN